MGRSLGFGSATRYYKRPVRTRFRFGSSTILINLATYKQLAGSLCKRHAIAPNNGALTARRRTVSDSVSLPSRGSFHHSLTVLFAIGGRKYLALDGGPPGFTQDFS